MINTYTVLLKTVTMILSLPHLTTPFSKFGGQVRLLLILCFPTKHLLQLYLHVQRMWAITEMVWQHSHNTTQIDIVHQTGNMYISYMYVLLAVWTSLSQTHTLWWHPSNSKLADEHWQKKQKKIVTYFDIHYGDKQHGHCIIRPCVGQNTHTR